MRSRAASIGLCVAALLLGTLGASAQTGGASGTSTGARPGGQGTPGAIDLVVMLDTSESMFPYFDDLRTYLLRDLLKEKLHRGDTFHLLSFAGSPEVETAVQLSSADAAQRAFGRLQLLQPLGRYTDLIAALQFLHRYVRQLPETNPKTILILTDGIHDPPPGSPWRLPPDKVEAAVREAAAAIGREGWTVQILKVPAEAGTEAAGGAGGPGQPRSYLDDISRALGTSVVPYDPGRKTEVTGLLTGYPTLIFPADLGSVGRRFVAPFGVRNYRGEPILLHLAGVQGEHAQLLERPVSVTVPANGEAVLEADIRLPAGFPTGPRTEAVHLAFTDGIRISPVDGTLAFTFTGRGALPSFSPLYIVYLVVAAAVIYALVRLFLLMRRKLHEVSLEGLARATAAEGAGTDGHHPAAPAADGHRPVHVPGKRVPLLSVGARSEAAATLEAGAARRRVAPTVQSLRRALPAPATTPGGMPPLIEMRVTDQNSRIGMRNVHRIMPGSGRSVGGGRSSFLIFLFRMPRAVAEICNVDGSYTFTPLRREYFPALAGPLEDCFGRPIPMVGPKGQPMNLHFRAWVSALEEINALMRSVRRD